MTDKLNIDELEKAKNGLSSLKSKADWLDFHTLKLIPADLVEVMQQKKKLLKKMSMMNKLMKFRTLILVIQLQNLTINTQSRS